MLKTVILLWLSCLTCGAASIIPESIGGLPWQGVDCFEADYPGYGLCFDFYDSQTTATFYVYDKSKAREESDIAPELASVRKEVQKVVQKGEYKAAELLSSTNFLPRSPWQMEAFHITHTDGQECFSVAAISVKAGRFCKLRLTGPLNQKDALLQTLSACLKAFDAFGGQVDPKCGDPAWVLSIIDHFKRQTTYSDSLSKEIVKTVLPVHPWHGPVDRGAARAIGALGQGRRGLEERRGHTDRGVRDGRN